MNSQPSLPNPRARSIVRVESKRSPSVQYAPRPIEEFPFVTEDDRATWIGLAFTPILRPLLPRSVSVGVIHQPRQRQDQARQHDRDTERRSRP
jgi:hypothetical protein